MTRDLQRLNAVRTALEQGGVAYVTRSETLASAGRGRGMPGMRAEASATYRVYVRKGDAEKARRLIGENAV